jgi:hypothetical protein
MTAKAYTEWDTNPKILLGELGAQPPLPEPGYLAWETSTF